MEVVGKIAAIAAIGGGDGILQCWHLIVSDVVPVDAILHNSAIGIPFNASAIVFQDADVCATVEFLYSDQGHDRAFTKRHEIDVRPAKIKSCALKVGHHPVVCN